MTAIYTLTSTLHDEAAVSRATREFLESLHIDYTLKGNDYADYGTHALQLIYVRTGGTEGIFKSLLPQLQQQSGQPFYLLTSGKSNSLAASMEILSYLRQNGIEGEIIHGSPEYISKRVNALKCNDTSRSAPPPTPPQGMGENEVLQSESNHTPLPWGGVGGGLERGFLDGCRLGIIGQPSDWLISSHTDKNIIKEKLGIELIDIPIQELLESLENNIDGGKAGALKIYDALKIIIDRYRLQGFTLRCFDLLSAVHNTGCLALAKLNSEGIVAGCEGDVPAMLTMKIAQALTGIIGFQANPASINPETGEMVFAHCTIPLNLVERYELDTHFESGIGIGIRGYMKEGPVTIFKVSADLTRSFIAEGQLIRNEAKPDLCRTQQVIRLDESSLTSYFLTRPIGNHHIILPGRHKTLLQKIIK